MRMKRIALLCLLGALALAGSACARRAKDPHVLRFRYWGDVVEVNILTELVRRFEESHPGVKVVPERKASDSTYADVLLAELAAGDPPDVMFLDAEGMDKLIREDVLVDLSPYLAADPTLKAADYYPAIVSRFTRGGKLLALPRDVSSVSVVYYNKALFDAAKVPTPKDGWNWDDLRRKAKALTKRGADGVATQTGFADDRNSCESWILSSGGRIVDDPLRPGWVVADSPEAVRGVQFRADLMHKDRVMPSPADRQATNASSDALFMNGKLAMFHSGIWKSPTFRQITAFDWDMVLFPKGPTGKEGFMGGGSGYSVSRKAPDPKLAWELVRYLGGEEGQKRLAATGLAQPAIRKLAESPAFLDGQKPLNKKALLHAAEVGTMPPNWDPWLEFLNGMWMPATDRIWVSDFQGDVGPVLKKAVAEANRKFFPAPKP